jgi:single-stranded DNA-binding protein
VPARSTTTNALARIAGANWAALFATTAASSGRIAATLKAGTPIIVEGKIKPETYTADGVEHKTFSIKADYIRKINYSAQNEVSESKAAKPAKKAK